LGLLQGRIRAMEVQREPTRRAIHGGGFCLCQGERANRRATHAVQQPQGRRAAAAPRQRAVGGARPRVDAVWERGSPAGTAPCSAPRALRPGPPRHLSSRRALAAAQISAGGLVSALMGVSNYTTLWVGWPGGLGGAAAGYGVERRVS
jgi:hypothetical protein